MQEMFSNLNLRKGEVYYVQFDGIGYQQQGLRPAVVVQANFLNEINIMTVIVCPFTTRLRHLSTQPIINPTHQNGLRTESAVIGEQIFAVNRSQLQNKIGVLSDEDLRRVEEALLLVFDISDVYRRDEI